MTAELTQQESWNHAALCCVYSARIARHLQASIMQITTSMQSATEGNANAYTWLFLKHIHA
jgi:hypothetical protein